MTTRTRKPRIDLSQKRLKELLHCDQDGDFYWAIRRGNIKAGSRAGCLTADGYICIRVDGGLYLSHRLVWLFHHGEFPEKGIDHIDGIKTNNAIENLRACDQSQNSQNRRTARRGHKVGLLGVKASGRKFQARIQDRNGSIFIGTFKTAEEAHQAYLNKKREIHAFCEI